MGITTSLRQALKRILYPHVREVGFTVDTADQPQSTTFRRITGDVLDVFDIQWDDHAKPRFVINFAQATSPQTDPYGNGYPHLRSSAPISVKSVFASSGGAVDHSAVGFNFGAPWLNNL